MTQTQSQPTCAERVHPSFENRIEEIRIMLSPTTDDVQLVDDGTLDTVLRIGEYEYRYGDTSVYREEDGTLDLELFLADEFDDICSDLWERFHEYGLSFDYVEPDTFEDQREGYFRFQISYGGPSEEFRFYVNVDGSMHRAEYWYLDWFDGAGINVTGHKVVETMWDIAFSEIAAETRIS